MKLDYLGDAGGWLSWERCKVHAKVAFLVMCSLSSVSVHENLDATLVENSAAAEIDGIVTDQYFPRSAISEWISGIIVVPPDSHHL